MDDRTCHPGNADLASGPLRPMALYREKVTFWKINISRETVNNAKAGSTRARRKEKHENH